MKLERLVGSKPSNKLGQKVRFGYYAPQANAVFLVGTFNDWNERACPLQKDKSGQWQTAIPLTAGRYEYRYLVDGVWECDPNTQECVPNPFGSWNCVVTVQ